MTKLLLSLSLAVCFITGAAQTDNKIWFQTDFSFLKPFTAQQSGKQPIGDPMADDGMAGFHKEVIPYRFHSTKAGSITAAEALQAQGFGLTGVQQVVDKKGEPVKPRTPDEYVYLQKGHYLKLGVGNYYAGIVLPAVDFSGAPKKILLTINWCPVWHGNPDKTPSTRKYDPTQLIVVVKNGDKEKQYPFPKVKMARNDKLLWITSTVELDSANLSKGSQIIIRPADEFYPPEKCRPINWYLKDILINSAQ